jgi:hypothetical protein
VTPQWHDEFVALCALFPSGELTEEEWALLQVHLAYCDSCRAAFEEYRQLANHVMPAVAASAYSEAEIRTEASSFSLEVAEQRLMSRLDSAPVGQEPSDHRKMTWKTSAGLIAAGVVGITCLLSPRLIRNKTRATTPVSVSVYPEGPKPAVPDSAQPDLRPALELAQHQVTTLQQQLSAAEDKYQQSSLTAASIKQQLETEQDQRKTLADEKNALNQQLIAAQTEVQSLRDNVTVANQTTPQQTAQTVALEAKVHELNTALDEKDRMLVLDKEFLAHDREIRDLIGARDLYIADIYDVAQNGKTAKPFGRIFYTKDKSLVFYGYDLDKQAGLKQSVAFQAWGSGDDKQNVSLGLFYQDDTHKRWVLRFNDTKTLARLNMVFVTAEPQGGSTKPTGKPLLLAYLQAQPNHP